MKKIAVITRKLDIGGVEISLLNFLKNLDSNKYDVTLILTEYSGVLLNRVPSHVKIKAIQFDGPEYLKLTELDKKLPFLQEMKFKFILRRCQILRRHTDQPLYYEAMLHSRLEGDIHYDLAIDYHGYGYFTTIFMCHKIKAGKYITFIHDDKLDFMENIRSLTDKIDHFFCVSEACRNHMREDFSILVPKLKVFYNIVDVEGILKKADDPQNDIPDNQKNVLVTVGRLEWQKGYDIALNASKMLLDRGVDFHWYIVGEGSWYEKLQRVIRENGLSANVVMLGASGNPYPYIKRADVYIQTSRHEGYGLAVCEAKVLCKPIVSTDLPCIREQIIHCQNGILCSHDAKDVAESIERLLNDKILRENLIQELTTNGICFENQMEMLEAIIGETE